MMTDYDEYTSSPSGTHSFSRKCDALARTLLLIMLVALLACAGLLFVVGLACTAVPSSAVPGSGYSELEAFLTWRPDDGLFEQAAGLMIACVLASITVRARGSLGKLPMRRVGLLCSVAAFVFQIIWIWVLRTDICTYDDSQALMVGAQAIVEGNYAAFDFDLGASGIQDGKAYYSALRASYNPGMYFHLYPFQAGGLLWVSLLVAVFGEGCYSVIQVLNAFANSASVVVLGLIARDLFEDSRVTNMTLCLSASFLPMLFLCEFAYGNTIGATFALLFVLFIIRALKCTELHGIVIFLIISVAFLICSVIFKPTFKLFGLVLLAVSLFYALLQKRALPVLLMVLGGVLAFKIPDIACGIVEHMVGRSFGDGIPMVSWIAMGLRSDSTAGPGWWSYYPTDVFVACQGDGARQSAVMWSEITSSMNRFLSHPVEAVQFFGQKIASEWADPSYQSLYYAANHAVSENGRAGTIVQEHLVQSTVAAKVLYGKLNWTFIRLLDGYQLVVYTGFFAGLLFVTHSVNERTHKNTPSRKPKTAECTSQHDDQDGESELVVHAAIVICILLGFFVYVLWEAKSVYVLPFATLLLPYAALGLSRVLAKADDRGSLYAIDKR